ncbi:MAG: hypothetical protein ACKOYN_07865, partial [Planctomycetota bacterium]
MKSRALLAAILSAAAVSGVGLDAYSTALAIAPQDGPVLGGPTAGQTGLLPRNMVPKPKRDRFVLPVDPETGEPWYTGNIVLKFHDGVRA